MDPDLILTEDSFLDMCDYVEKNNPQVYGACFNIDNQDEKDKISCCLNLPDLDHETRVYHWIDEVLMKKLLLKNRILKVKFSGGLHFVRRDIFKKIPYFKIFGIDNRPEFEKTGGFAADLAFAHNCNYLNIDIEVDLSIKLKHLRYYSNPIFENSNTQFLKKC